MKLLDEMRENSQKIFSRANEISKIRYKEISSIMIGFTINVMLSPAIVIIAFITIIRIDDTIIDSSIINFTMLAGAVATIVLVIISSIIISIIVFDNFDKIVLILNEWEQLIKNQANNINRRLNLRCFFKSIILCLLPSECQIHFEDESQSILKTNKKCISYYKIIKLYFWEMLLMRIINSCYLRIKNAIFRSFIK